MFGSVADAAGRLGTVSAPSCLDLVGDARADRSIACVYAKTASAMEIQSRRGEVSVASVAMRCLAAARHRPASNSKRPAGLPRRKLPSEFRLVARRRAPARKVVGGADRYRSECVCRNPSVKRWPRLQEVRLVAYLYRAVSAAMHCRAASRHPCDGRTARCRTVRHGRQPMS